MLQVLAINFSNELPLGNNFLTSSFVLWNHNDIVFIHFYYFKAGEIFHFDFANLRGKPVLQFGGVSSEYMVLVSYNPFGIISVPQFDHNYTGRDHWK